MLWVLFDLPWCHSERADKARRPRQEAEAAERSEPPMVATCRAIVGMAVGLGVEPEDRSRTWKADAEEALKRGRRAHSPLLCHVLCLNRVPGSNKISTEFCGLLLCRLPTWNKAGAFTQSFSVY